MTLPYATADYVQSLPHMGGAMEVPEWRTWVIVRPLADGRTDVCGPYPLAVIAEDADLEGGLERLRLSGAVSVTLVLDDFNRPDLARIERLFDPVTPFKTHYVVDRAIGEAAPSKHHRYDIRRALNQVSVKEFCLDERLDDWIELYDALVRRHGLGGLHAFPREHHLALARSKDFVAVGAFQDDVLAAAHIWAVSGTRVHSHLAASSERGYRMGAAYAVNDCSIRLFSEARIINLGGGAGRLDNPDDGLARFKRGFANATARAYICGKVLDPDAYRHLARARGAEDSGYFPAYRTP